MSKHSYSDNRMDEYERVVTAYKERFGEDSGFIYSFEPEAVIEAYKECLEKDKSFEELFGAQSTEVLY